MTCEPKPRKNDYAQGIDGLTEATYPDAFTLIELTVLLSTGGTGIDQYGMDLVRTVHSCGLLLVMSGSTASSDLDHD